MEYISNWNENELLIKSEVKSVELWSLSDVSVAFGVIFELKYHDFIHAMLFFIC